MYKEVDLLYNLSLSSTDLPLSFLSILLLNHTTRIHSFDKNSVVSLLLYIHLHVHIRIHTQLHTSKVNNQSNIIARRRKSTHPQLTGMK